MTDADTETTTRARRQVFHQALADVVEIWDKTCGRKPTTEQLLEALGATLIARDEAADGDEPDATAEDAVGLLSSWRACPPLIRPHRRPRIKAGDVIHIPYGAHGARAILGRLLFVPSKSAPGPGYGPCLLVIDKDAPEDIHDYSKAALAKFVKGTTKLLRPCHPGVELFKEGYWTVLGNVPFEDPARVLPFFKVRLVEERRTILRDYSGAEVPDTPDNQARVVPGAVGDANEIVGVIRALRGLARWRDRYKAMLPPGTNPPA